MIDWLVGIPFLDVAAVDDSASMTALIQHSALKKELVLHDVPLISHK